MYALHAGDVVVAVLKFEARPVHKHGPQVIQRFILGLAETPGSVDSLDRCDDAGGVIDGSDSCARDGYLRPAFDQSLMSGSIICGKLDVRIDRFVVVDDRDLLILGASSDPGAVTRFSFVEVYGPNEV